MSSSVDEGGRKDGTSTEVARGLERRLPWDLTVGGELAANAEGGRRVNDLDSGSGGYKLGNKDLLVVDFLTRSHGDNSRFEHHLENISMMPR